MDEDKPVMDAMAMLGQSAHDGTTGAQEVDYRDLEDVQITTVAAAVQKYGHLWKNFPTSCAGCGLRQCANGSANCGLCDADAARDLTLKS